MTLKSSTNNAKVAFISGAAHRIGAELARQLHGLGFNLAMHYRSSKEAAENIRQELEDHRSDSVVLVNGDLLDTANNASIIEQAFNRWQRLDVLINNASSFYPTPLGTVTEKHWNDLLGTNLKAPFFLSQAAAPYLKQTAGCIVNIVDIHAERPLKNYPVYSIAKAGLVMLTKSLARELGPDIRVNAVAPGAILWPEHNMTDDTKTDIIERTALKRKGQPLDIAKAVTYLVRDATYMSGQVLTVDGGRSLSM